MQANAKVFALVVHLMLFSACSTGPANTVNHAAMDVSLASAPSRILTSQPLPIDPATDIINITARSEMALGMVMEILVTPEGPELTRIGMMQVRRAPRGADIKGARPRGGAQEPQANGDWVIVEAYGKGALVSRTAVSDPVFTAAEGAGLIRLKERTLYASLPTPRRVDMLAITATIAGKTKRIDVSRVMDYFCASAPNVRICQDS